MIDKSGSNGEAQTRGSQMPGTYWVDHNDGGYELFHKGKSVAFLDAAVGSYTCDLQIDDGRFVNHFGSVEQVMQIAEEKLDISTHTKIICASEVPQFGKVAQARARFYEQGDQYLDHLCVESEMEKAGMIWQIQKNEERSFYLLKDKQGKTLASIRTRQGKYCEKNFEMSVAVGRADKRISYHSSLDAAKARAAESVILWCTSDHEKGGSYSNDQCCRKGIDISF